MSSLHLFAQPKTKGQCLKRLAQAHVVAQHGTVRALAPMLLQPGDAKFLVLFRTRFQPKRQHLLPRTLGSGGACKRGFIQVGFDDENVFDALCIARLQLLRAFLTGHDVVQLLQRCDVGWGSCHGLVGNGDRALTLRQCRLHVAQ